MNGMALGQILSQSLTRNEQGVMPATRPTASHSLTSLSKNLNRLLSAAVVNPRFRHLLLSDPVGALSRGYNGENFQLTPAEYAVVTSLSVNSVRDFAAQLLHRLTAGDAVLYAPEAQSDFQYVEIVA